MNKDQLIKKVSDLEEQLHISENSVEYWSQEAGRFLNELNRLKGDINESYILNFIKNCNIIQEHKIIEFIKNL